MSSKRIGSELSIIELLADNIFIGFGKVDGYYAYGKFENKNKKSMLRKGIVFIGDSSFKIIDNAHTIFIRHTYLNISNIKYSFQTEKMCINYDKMEMNIYSSNNLLLKWDRTSVINNIECRIMPDILNGAVSWAEEIELPIKCDIANKCESILNDIIYYDFYQKLSIEMSKRTPITVCVICSDNRPVMCLSCGHVVYCIECYEQRIIPAETQLNCPLCCVASSACFRVYY